MSPLSSLSGLFSTGDVFYGVLVASAILLIGAIWARRASEYRTIMLALQVKLLASLGYNMVLVFTYAAGDALTYHRVGIDYANVIRADLADGTYNYLLSEPFFWITGYSTSRFNNLCGLVHFMAFDSFIGSTFIFAAMSFLGQLLLYRTFVVRYPDPRLRLWWKLGILFFPGLTFWSAGMLKESVGLWALGCAVWGAHRYQQRSSLKHFLLMAVGLYGLFLFRYQVLPAALAGIIPWLLEAPQSPDAARSPQARGRKVSPDMMSRRVVCAVLIVISLVGMKYAGESQKNYALDQLPETVANQSSMYQAAPVVSFDGSWQGMLLAAPIATASTLFRPFFWEAPTLLMQMAALENLLLLVLSLRAFSHVWANPELFKRAVRAPMFVTCLVFVLLFAVLVGASTPNLGTLSRYRIPLLPFLVGVLVILEYQWMEFRAAVSQERNQWMHTGRRRAASLSLAGPGQPHAEV